MNFFDQVASAFGGQADAQRQAEEQGLPPLTFSDLSRRNREGGLLEQLAEQGIYPQQGMESLPVGPGGARAAAPALRNAVPAVRGSLTGSVSGAQPVPYKPQPGRQGETVDGSIVGRAIQAITGRGGPQPQPGGATRINAGRGAGVTGGGGNGMPPGGGPVPRGNQPAPGGGGSGGAKPGTVQQPGFFEKMWNNANLGQKVGGVGAIGGGLNEVGQMLGNIFGSGSAEGQQQEAPKIPWPDQPGSGSDGGAAAPLPQSYRSQLEEMIPSVDYDNLPRPDFARARELMAGLAPEAPEERNFMDKLPTNMKNILGFGILLGPLGLLLGAGMGMSENQSIDRARKEQFKQESREHLRDMIGFDLDWGKAERSMALQEQEGARDQALGMLETDMGMQQHEMGLRESQSNLATQGMRRQALAQQMSGDQFDIDKLFQRAMLMQPQQVSQMWSALQQADDAPMNLSGDQAETYNQMMKANIVRALYE